MRVASHAGTRPPCSGRSATPERFTLLIVTRKGQAWKARTREGSRSVSGMTPAAPRGTRSTKTNSQGYGRRGWRGRIADLRVQPLPVARPPDRRRALDPFDGG